MKKPLLFFLIAAIPCVMVTGADGHKNGQAKWAFHFAGDHNSKVNTCAYQITDCLDAVETGPPGPGRFDVYVLAFDTDGIAGTRYGLCCPQGGFSFYGWTNCSDLQIATPTWPGCGEGIAQTFALEQPPGHVTLGILDVYVYAGTGLICFCDDPRTGFAEWCDGTAPNPICLRRTTAVTPPAFGCVGFGFTGYSPCAWIGVERSSWGAVKSLYR